MFFLPFVSLLLQAVPGITHGQVGTPVHGVRVVCVQHDEQVPSIKDAADAMCKTKRKSKKKDPEEKSKETKRTENKKYISEYKVAFRKCNVCSMWAMQFTGDLQKKGNGDGRVFGGWNTLVEVRKNFHARVREKLSKNTPTEGAGDSVSGERYRGILNK
jgi:hypothetical protein